METAADDTKNKCHQAFAWNRRCDGFMDYRGGEPGRRLMPPGGRVLSIGKASHIRGDNVNGRTSPFVFNGEIAGGQVVVPLVSPPTFPDFRRAQAKADRPTPLNANRFSGRPTIFGFA
jgi:hypothetical protein